MCPKHKVENSKAYNRARGSSTSRGYDADWERLRKVALKRDNYICQYCLQKTGRIVLAEAVDHKIPFYGKSDSRRLDLDNLVSTCTSCHSSKTAKYDGGFGHTRQIRPND
jgi:5-methylcytosine-specific restriction enzyme A